MPVENSVLIEQLNAFMHSVIAQWSWDQLAALEHEHVEYRGPESDLLTFSLSILEKENGARPYLNVLVSVCDFRSERGLGSAYRPLCNNFIYFRDGVLDVADKVALE